MSHFYMTLPSNSSMKSHPENTVAQFTTVLAQPMELSGDWEVALTEISCPAGWYNINKEDHWFELDNIRFSLPDDMYLTVKSVLDQMVELMKTRQRFHDAETRLMNRKLNPNVIQALAQRPNIILAHNKPANRVLFVIPERQSMTLSPALMKVLGFQTFSRSDNLLQFPSVAIIAQDEPSLRVNPLLAYVYCDLIEPVVVGDTKVPLLRTAIIDGHVDQLINHIYPTPIYAPLQRKTFNTVEINIMSDTGEPMPFISGKSVVVLHFRRTSNPYFL